MNEFQTLPISVFRKDANRILNSIKKTGGYCLLSRSLPKAVILDIAKYEELKELLEDLVDAAKLEKARGGKTISWKNYLNKRYEDKQV